MCCRAHPSCDLLFGANQHGRRRQLWNDTHMHLINVDRHLWMIDAQLIHVRMFVCVYSTWITWPNCWQCQCFSSSCDFTSPGSSLASLTRLVSDTADISPVESRYLIEWFILVNDLTDSNLMTQCYAWYSVLLTPFGLYAWWDTAK